MLAKTGLLIVSNPNHIGKILSSIQKKVQNTLYIQILSALDNLGHPNNLANIPKHSQAIRGIYSQAAKHCQNLDVRVLLSGLKQPVPTIQTRRQIDLLILDKIYNQSDIDVFVQGKICNKNENCNIVVVEAGNEDEIPAHPSKDKVYSHTVLGGTFDRLHLAHKVLLSEAALRSSKKVTIGVTEECMLHSKTLWELIDPVQKRIDDVREFLTDICPELEINVVPIADAFGPTKDDPTMDLLIVSAETLKGAEKVNEVRNTNGLKPLDILAVELIDEPFPGPNEESKISSGTLRLRLLGTVINPIKKNEKAPKKPYIIGLTGGIASGKSGVSQRLEEHGAKVINCDKVGHEVYKQGKPCYYELIEAFGKEIISETGEIDRKVLGGLVFSNPSALERLNSLVWPAIGKEVTEILTNTDAKVVVVEAAILVKAGWHQYCHEVWTTMVPEEEAIQRLQSRNALTEEQAKDRLKAQDPNKKYVENANVVFCTLWAYEFTRLQVDRAWSDLLKRLN